MDASCLPQFKQVEGDPGGHEGAMLRDEKSNNVAKNTKENEYF